MKGMTEDEFAEAAREAEEKYGDIINLPHPVSKSHPAMPRSDRAAQFAPFAALNGFPSEIEKAARRSEREQERSVSGGDGFLYSDEPDENQEN